LQQAFALIIYVVDPLHRPYTGIHPILIAWYKDAYEERFGRGTYTKEWTIQLTGRSGDNINTPKQTDGSSCGVFISMILYYYMLNGQLPDQNAFQNSDIPKARHFMLHQIMDGKRRASTIELNYDEDNVVISDEERDAQQAILDYYAKDTKIAGVIDLS